jgi:hypothetical protein
MAQHVKPPGKFNLHFGLPQTLDGIPDITPAGKYQKLCSAQIFTTIKAFTILIHRYYDYTNMN